MAGSASRTPSMDQTLTKEADAKQVSVETKNHTKAPRHKKFDAKVYLSMIFPKIITPQKNDDKLPFREKPELLHIPARRLQAHRLLRPQRHLQEEVQCELSLTILRRKLGDLLAQSL